MCVCVCERERERERVYTCKRTSQNTKLLQVINLLTGLKPYQRCGMFWCSMYLYLSASLCMYIALSHDTIKSCYIAFHVPYEYSKNYLLWSMSPGSCLVTARPHQSEILKLKTKHLTRGKGSYKTPPWHNPVLIFVQVREHCKVLLCT